MIPLTTLVQTATYDLTPSNFRVNKSLWKGFIVLNKIHSIWRGIRYYEVYSNPDNLSSLLAGHTLNFIAQGSVILRVAAQCLLISTRLLECIESEIALSEACKFWKEAVFGYYPKPVKACWKDSSCRSFCKVKGKTYLNRIERIAICTLSIFKHSLKLSMRILDTIDAFSLSPNSKAEAFNESFVNAMKCIDALVESQEALLNGFVENQIFIEKILEGSKLTYEDLYHAISKTLEKTEKVHTQTKRFKAYANGIIIDTGKRTIDEIMVAFGLSRLRPLWLVINST